MFLVYGHFPWHGELQIDRPVPRLALAPQPLCRFFYFPYEINFPPMSSCEIILGFFHHCPLAKKISLSFSFISPNNFHSTQIPNLFSIGSSPSLSPDSNLIFFDTVPRVQFSSQFAVNVKLLLIPFSRFCL